MMEGPLGAKWRAGGSREMGSNKWSVVFERRRRSVVDVSNGISEHHRQTYMEGPPRVKHRKGGSMCQFVSVIGCSYSYNVSCFK
jgi:hypothetical protein